MKLFFRYFFLMCLSSMVGFFGLRYFAKGSSARAAKPFQIEEPPRYIKPHQKPARATEVQKPSGQKDANQREIGRMRPGKIAIQISGESPDGFDGAQTFANHLAQIVKDEQPSLVAKGVRRFVVHQTMGEHLHIELLAYNSQNNLIGNFLLREKQTSMAFVKLALSGMWKSRAKGDEISGKLVVGANGASGARAYVNGFPLTRKLSGENYVFKFRMPGNQDLDKFTLAIASDNGPLISSAIERGEFHRVHKWTLPESSKETR